MHDRSQTPPADLLLTDPQGRRMGRDPLTNTSYEGIPRAGYIEEGGIVDLETGELARVYRVSGGTLQHPH